MYSNLDAWIILTVFLALINKDVIIFMTKNYMAPYVITDCRNFISDLNHRASMSLHSSFEAIVSCAPLCIKVCPSTQLFINMLGALDTKLLARSFRNNF